MKTLSVIAIGAALACGLWLFVTYPQANPFLLIGLTLLFGLVAIPAIMIVTATVTFFALEGIDALGVFLGWWKADDRRTGMRF
jgi:hypothetical protein